MTAIVELKNATKVVKNGFDEEKIILNDVSLEIFEQDFITILGGNGAGKSTLFNTIAGTLSLTSGTIRILGEDVTKEPIFYNDEELFQRRRAISAIPGYANLVVIELPDGIAYTGLSSNGAILSPFNHDQKLIADTESCEYFISQVLESAAFQNVVQWTLDYAPKSTKRSAETVKNEYKKLMQEYYQVLHSNNK